MEFIVVTKTTIKLPFMVEGDTGGSSWIKEENCEIFHINYLAGHGEISRQKLTKQQAHKLIQETMELRRSEC